MIVVAHVQDQVASSAPVALLAVGVAAVVGFVFVWRRNRRHAAGSDAARGVWWRRAALAATGLVAFLAVTGFVVRDEWTWVIADGSVRSDGVAAPAVEVGAGQELYRIGPGSEVGYTTTERLAGDESTVTGTTSLVAGEIAVDRVEPDRSRIGTIVVNVEAFESDSSLRDKRIRHDFLESTEHPYAEFRPTAIDGLPGRITEGRSYEVVVDGDLTVKQTTAPETFTGTVTLDGDRLVATVGTTVLMSTYDVGPIATSGLVSTVDEVRLDFELVATRATRESQEQAVGRFQPDEVDVVEAPFSERVQPVLEANCVSCHEAGGVGNATFALERAGDAAEVADDLALVTGFGYMPPWPASDASIDFAHDWSLSEDEKQEIAQWATAGGGLDVPADTPLEASGEAVREVDADVILRGEPYAGDEEHLDDYRCQVYAFPDVDDTRWLRSFTVLPDEDEVVHHAVFFHVSADGLEEARALDRADPGAGWHCFGLSGLGRDAEQIAAWAPGQQPMEFREGTGVPVEPGEFLVVQIHYHYEHEFPEDTSEVAVDFASRDELDSAGGALRTVANSTYLAPAEIPCRDDEEGPLCDREAVLDGITDDFGLGARFIPDALLAQCGQQLEDYLDDTDGVAHASCTHRVRNPGEVVGVFGHMHEFGRSFRMTLNPGTSEERVVLDIPNWSFDWQLHYEPTDALVVDADDTLLIECTWDRRLAPMPEPRYITWNEGTRDEMCYSTLATVPVDVS